jgi:hypothetical protein
VLAAGNVKSVGGEVTSTSATSCELPTTGKASGGSRPQSDSRANTVSIPVERLTAGIFKGGHCTHGGVLSVTAIYRQSSQAHGVVAVGGPRSYAMW